MKIYTGFWRSFGFSLFFLFIFFACENKTNPENPEKIESYESIVREYTIREFITLEENIPDTSEPERHFLDGQKWDVLGRTIGARIEFINEKYIIEFAVGGFYSTGDYMIENDVITLFYPEVKEARFYGINVFLDYLFKDETQIELVYDPDYVDFDFISCLRNENVILGNQNRPSPAGQVYMLQGYEVIKYPEMESMVLILENLRMREEPNINANTVSLRRFIPGINNQTFTSHLTYKNAIKPFDAKTVREDTIDGITAPWYRISVILGEISSEYVWVFGGYVRELGYSEMNRRSLYDTYYQSLVDMNVIDAHPNRYSEYP